ncbi:MAG TPA: hypothetical protein PKA56_04975 [Solirubrobacterales bacterium]|nr:hypothetical protein [Solirubrobacterales bacterium]HMX71087.1 hypothetical protein [Solirubrobacterales bacterium]HMY25249.1 hypothetical protein [Solirubrobacterales bacterium]HNA23998.1 hypothetical protein [Solirubrobacterales bacterium]HNA44269.1 hypothetical protein [Solirubrobacterales bacterium]
MEVRIANSGYRALLSATAVLILFLAWPGSEARGSGFAALTTGATHGCALRSSGEALCWGANSEGQLGDGGTEKELIPTPVEGLADATSISAGNSHTCAIRGSGQVVCWGSNGNGQLGDGLSDHLTPEPVPGLNDATSISAGDSHTCAIRSSGQAVCWGYNGWGQIGDGTTDDSLTPTAVPGLTDATEIAAGWSHSCAIRTGGQVVCWGGNASGQIGDGTTDDQLTPTPVTGLTDAVSIAVGQGQSCAVRTSGQAVCWGDNSGGQLGDGTTDDRLTPTAVIGLTDAGEITAGGSHTCAIRTTGQAVCWGTNRDGQLGDGTSSGDEDPDGIPTPVSSLSNALNIAAGDSYTCAIRGIDQAVCWGKNNGRLGDGTLQDRLLPTAVSDLPPPVIGVTVNLVKIKGKVTTKCPGERRFRKLIKPRQVKVGCRLDTRKGTVSLTSAKAKKSGTQAGRFWGGLFRVGQTRRKTLTTMNLTGSTKCPVNAPHRRPIRRGWGKDKGGKFRIGGHGGSASSRGTHWGVVDRCDGSTKVLVKEGSVSVRDFVRKKTVTVRAGHSYVTGKRKR